MARSGLILSVRVVVWSGTGLPPRERAVREVVISELLEARVVVVRHFHSSILQCSKAFKEAQRVSCRATD